MIKQIVNRLQITVAGKAAGLLVVLLFLLTFISCTTGLDTQMSAVLDRMEEEMGYVNTVSSSEVAKVTDWFLRRGDDGQKARALYCLGRSQFNEKSYPAAIVSYTRALEYVEKTEDVYRQGLICLDMARTCGASGNTSDESVYLARAAEAFGAAGYPEQKQRTLLEIGQAQAAMGQFEAAEDIFKSVLYDVHQLRDTLLEARCLESYAALAVTKDVPDPALAIGMLGRAADDLHYPLSCSDKGILAYSYSLSGDSKEALKWLSNAKASAETDEDVADTDFREYQIASRSGDTARALKALERVNEYADKAQGEALGEAVSASQRDYIQAQSDIQGEKLRAARLRLWLLALAALLVIGAMVVAYMYYSSVQKRRLNEEIAEREKYMSIAEDLGNKILRYTQDDNGSQDDKGAQDGKSVARVKGPGFDALERLCEQYYVFEGTENLKPRILKEVKSIVDGLRSDKKVRKDLENSLDAAKDGVMTKLRAEFPSWKEEDFQLYAFTAAGFSSTTISALMEKEKSVIYNRVWRLKGRISSSDSALKDFFLACLEN